MVNAVIFAGTLNEAKAYARANNVRWGSWVWPQDWVSISGLPRRRGLTHYANDWEANPEVKKAHDYWMTQVEI